MAKKTKPPFSFQIEPSKYGKDGKIYLPWKIFKKLKTPEQWDKAQLLCEQFEVIIPDYTKLSQRIIHFIKTVDKDDIDAFWKKYDNFWKSFDKAMNNVLGPKKDYSKYFNNKPKTIKKRKSRKSSKSNKQHNTDITNAVFGPKKNRKRVTF